MIRKVQNQLENRDDLTEDDRSTLHIFEEDTERTRVAVPDHAPLVFVEKIIHLVHKIRFRDPENPNTKKKPEGVKFIECEMSIAGGRTEKKSTGKFLLTFEFTDEEVGKKATYRSRYVNTRGEAGPWSDNVIGIIA